MNFGKIITISRLPPRKISLLIEASIRALIAVFAIYLVPFKWWSPHLLGSRILGDIEIDQIATPACPKLKPLPEILKDVRWAVLQVNRVFSGRLTCLAQAISGKALLDRRGIDSVVVLGVRTGGSQCRQDGTSGGLAAHAWLCVGDIVLLGDEARAGHVPVARYGSVSVTPASPPSNTHGWHQ